MVGEETYHGAQMPVCHHEATVYLASSDKDTSTLQIILAVIVYGIEIVRLG
jgi:hypothetical protein